MGTAPMNGKKKSDFSSTFQGAKRKRNVSRSQKWFTHRCLSIMTAEVRGLRGDGCLGLASSSFPGNVYLVDWNGAAAPE